MHSNIFLFTVCHSSKKSARTTLQVNQKMLCLQLTVFAVRSASTRTSSLNDWRSLQKWANYSNTFKRDKVLLPITKQIIYNKFHYFLVFCDYKIFMIIFWLCQKSTPIIYISIIMTSQRNVINKKIWANAHEMRVCKLPLFISSHFVEIYSWNAWRSRRLQKK